MCAKSQTQVSLKPAWEYRPGPEVCPEAPSELEAAQRVAIGAAEAACAMAVPGCSERELEEMAAEAMLAAGATGVWTPTNVGVGAGSRECFPTVEPSERALSAVDVAVVDVHPILPSGAWGDCTRTAVIGDNPDAARALRQLELIHTATLEWCRPGMPASELFGQCEQLIAAAGFELLDRLANIGHSLSAGAAYLHGFIDAGNETPMWGAWAIEPFVGRNERGFKLEDVVWFGRDGCMLVGR
jgi:Xaa-Pro dipeptidase